MTLSSQYSANHQSTLKLARWCYWWAASV